MTNKENDDDVDQSNDERNKNSRKRRVRQTGEEERNRLVKLDLNERTDPAAAVKELAEKHGIDIIDLVIANASTGYIWPKVRDAEVDDFRAHMETNVFGFVELVKGFLPVLERTAAKKAEKGEDKEVVWVTIGSGGGFLNNPAAAAVPNAAYGITKAAQHYLTGKLHHEKPWLTSFSIDPGWARTDMGNAGPRALGIDEAYGDPDESAKGMLKVFDAATGKTHSGKMWTAEGETVLF
ncbi:hypothetical protein QBC32DRAFT_388654 [Pseudoneurospora amorphoporcata]|uniref:Uncharacterized protein n=1 Tax=Pseudoneurospora amorphoporcata TaxID=241081 RepID=A0AAN6P046_9PEZI|nr:hypothetical protein QBC32DRAFT_388654 [Pseudoneurospora amorphoporcata]